MLLPFPRPPPKKKTQPSGPIIKARRPKKTNLWSIAHRKYVWFVMTMHGWSSAKNWFFVLDVDGSVQSIGVPRWSSSILDSDLPLTNHLGFSLAMETPISVRSLQRSHDWTDLIRNSSQTFTSHWSPLSNNTLLKKQLLATPKKLTRKVNCHNFGWIFTVLSLGTLWWSNLTMEKNDVQSVNFQQSIYG